jgi:deoxycytidine triphosphate deaminase
MVDPYDNRLLNDISLSVRVGSALLFGTPSVSMEFPNIRNIAFPEVDKTRSWAAIDLTKYSVKDPWQLRPGWLCLIKTLERVRLTGTLIANVSLGDLCYANGYGLTSPLVLTPGYVGAITLAIVNHNEYMDLPMYMGLPIAKLFFSKLSHKPSGVSRVPKISALKTDLFLAEIIPPEGKALPKTVIQAITEVFGQEEQEPQTRIHAQKLVAKKNEQTGSALSDMTHPLLEAHHGENTLEPGEGTDPSLPQPPMQDHI